MATAAMRFGILHGGGRPASKNATLQFRRAALKCPSWKNPMGTGPAEKMVSAIEAISSYAINC